MPVIRTEQKIQSQIALLAAADEHFAGDANLHSVLHSQIWALEWVLGIKHPEEYYCHGCHVMHSGLQCPECGNGVPDGWPVAEPEAKYLNTNEVRK